MGSQGAEQLSLKNTNGNFVLQAASTLAAFFRLLTPLQEAEL
jgi:hypothetical protein